MGRQGPFPTPEERDAFAENLAALQDQDQPEPDPEETHDEARTRLGMEHPTREDDN